MSNAQQPLDLTTVTGVFEYISQTPFAGDTVHSLSGGYANFVYRVHLRVPYRNRSTVVLKYAAPYIATSESKMPYAVERQNFEVAAMRTFRTTLHDDAIVTIPTIHHFDDIAHVVIMDDCGEEAINLKQLMLKNPPALSVANAIGIELGNFLAGLHSHGLDHEASNHDFFNANQQARAISGFATYSRVISTITGKDDLPALSNPSLNTSTSKIETISKISADRIHAINTSHQTLTMGDFWPGNILIRPSPNQNDTLLSFERIYILDWELVKPGLAGLDVGQFCAEMHLLRRFNPGCEESATAALNAFLESYRKGFDVDVELAKVAAVHVGAHLISWTPRVPWGSNETTREVVEEGVEYMIEGYKGTQDWLERSLVQPLL